MRVSVPDPSLQLRALDKLSPPLGPSATFRVQTFRSQTLLDQAPSEASVYQFSELLLAEAEDAVLGEAVEKGPKKSNVAKADGQDMPAGKGGKGKENGGKGKEKGTAKGQTTRRVCNLWRTEQGCKYGKACRFTHDALTPADKRCFNCSSTQHRKPDCPFPTSSGTEGDSAKKSGDTPSAASAKSAPSTPSDQDKSRGVGGTLLSNDPIEPIVSARQLNALGFRLIWTKRACQLFDEKGVSIPASVVSGCPRVSQALALKLIDRIELSKLNRCSVEGACKIQPKPGTWRDSMHGLKEALDGKATDRGLMWSIGPCLLGCFRRCLMSW